MKKILSMPKLNHLICSMLVLAAPMIVDKSLCIWLYGEPKCPESLK